MKRCLIRQLNIDTLYQHIIEIQYESVYMAINYPHYFLLLLGSFTIIQ